MTATMLAPSAAWAAAGFGFALAYFAALRRSVEDYAAGRGPLLPALLTAARVAAAAALFGIAARSGAAPLIASFLGFLTARAVVVRAARKSA